MRLAKFLGFEDDSELTDASESESELSELETSETGEREKEEAVEEEKGEEEKMELVEEELVEAARGVVEAPLVEAKIAAADDASMDLDGDEADDERSSADDFSPPTPPNERLIRPLPRRSPSPDLDDDPSPELDIILVRLPQTPSPPRANQICAAVDSTDRSPGGGETDLGAQEPQRGGQEQEARETNAGTAGDGEEAAAGPAESGGAGGDGKGEKDDDRPKDLGTGDLDVEVEEEEEKAEDEKEAKVDKGKGVELRDEPQGPSTSFQTGAVAGCGDEVDSEAAALLLLMFGGPDSKDEEKPDKPFNMTAATTYGSSPDTTPPSPPKPGSSAASAGSTGTLDLVDSQKNKKRSRASEGPQVVSRLSSAPRSTRRNSLVERASPSPPPARRAANRRVSKPLSRTSNSPNPSKSPKPVEASTSSLDKKPTTSVLDKKAVRLPQVERARSTSASASPRPQGESPEARGTRRSAPLQGGLRDLLASPAVTAVAGGYDPVSKRYVNKRVKSRSPSPEPEPVELPEVRGTRRSRPIDGDLRNLLASSLVTSVAGGYDPVSKRYVGKRGKSRSRSAEVEQEPEARPSTVRGTRRSRPLEGDIRSLLASPSVAAVAGGFDARSGKYFSR